MQAFFRDSAVKIALRFDFSALALLSLTASHLAQLQPHRRIELTERSFAYHNLAVMKAINVLSMPELLNDQDLLASLFLFSTLTIFHGMFPVPSAPSQGKRPDELQLLHTLTKHMSCL